MQETPNFFNIHSDYSSCSIGLLSPLRCIKPDHLTLPIPLKDVLMFS